MTVFEKYLSDEQATVALGKQLGASLAGSGAIVYLEGTLGAGKTTLCRGVLSAFGHSGPVKSPTYTLVEPYQFGQTVVYHFDLYRLGEPEELEFMGGRDYFGGENIALVEWPVRGEGFLPPADIVVNLNVAGEGRKLIAKSDSACGVKVLSSLE